MIQTLPCPPTQQVPMQGPSAAATQSPWLGPAFTEALDVLMGGGEETAAKPVHDESRPEPEVSQAALMELVGAVQVAVAMSAQTDVATTAEKSSDAVDGGPGADVAPIDTLSVGEQFVRTMPAAERPDAPTEAGAAMQHGEPAALQSDVVGSDGAVPYADSTRSLNEAPSPQTNGTAGDAKRVPAAKSEAGVLSDAVFVTTEHTTDVRDALTANHPLERSRTPVEMLQQATDQAVRSNESAEVRPIRTRPATAALGPMSAETPTVRLQFDPQRHPGFVEVRSWPLHGHAGRAETDRGAVEVDPAAVEDRPAATQGRSDPVQGRSAHAGSKAWAPSWPAVDVGDHSVARWASEPALRRTVAKNDRTSALGEVPDRQLPSLQTVAMGQRLSVQYPEAAARAVRPEPTDGVQTRIIDQVVRGISLHRAGERSDIVVKLNPPELGTLRVQVSRIAVDDAVGPMTAHIRAESSQVRGLLEAHMPLLMDSLARAGLQMDSVSVSVGSSFSAFAGSTHQHQQAQPDANGANRAAVGQRQAPMESVAAAESGWITSGQAGYSWLA